LACVFSSFAGDGGSHRRQGKEEGKKPFQIPSLLGFSHAPPVKAAHGADMPPLSCSSRSLPATVPGVQKTFPCNSRLFFRGYFVNLKLCSLIFFFLNLYFEMWM
jgi:hypothetical protein